jgi:hypothetical protein
MGFDGDSYEDVVNISEFGGADRALHYPGIRMGIMPGTTTRFFGASNIPGGSTSTSTGMP